LSQLDHFTSKTSEKAQELEEQSNRLQQKEVEMNSQLKAYLKVERDKLDGEKEIIQKDMKIKDTLIEQLTKQLKDS
jgi:hypothetical protein